MRLNQGVKAPIFITKDYQGKKINLSDYHGKRILLSFFRGASCPFCNLRVHELIKKQNEFKEQDIEIIAFFSSTKEEVQQYAGKKNPSFCCHSRSKI
jgi:peroxiredoxin